MSETTTPPKKDIYSYLAVLLFLALFVAGVWGVVSSRIASHEYKNSDDVRKVSAVVKDYELIPIKDGEGYTTDWKYEAKLSFDVDGKTYTGKDIFYREISKGDKVTVEVYRTKKGVYKLTPERNPVDFLLYCAAIVVGGFLNPVMIHSVVTPVSYTHLISASSTLFRGSLQRMITIRRTTPIDSATPRWCWSTEKPSQNTLSYTPTIPWSI